jgi:hypothetical protein
MPELFLRANAKRETKAERERRYPSQPISRVLCGGFPRPAIIPLGARVATRLQQPTRGSDGASSAVFPCGGSPLFGLAPDGGCLAARLAADAGGLLHRRFTLAWPLPIPSFRGNMGWGKARQCASLWPYPAGRPAPGVTRHRALRSADFPRSRKRDRDRPADLDTTDNISYKSSSISARIADFMSFRNGLYGGFISTLRRGSITRASEWYLPDPAARSDY